MGLLAECAWSEPKIYLKVAGSIGENSNILPMDEVDINIQVELDVHIEIHQRDTKSAIEELHKVTNKQPFPCTCYS